MERSYAIAYRELFHGHWWWRARERLILETIEAHRSRNGPETILDVGCGDGLFFDRLEQYGKVEGIEMEPAAVSSDSRWRNRIFIGPFDETFDLGRRYTLVLMLDVLEHFPDPIARLKWAGELLRPDGMLILTVPAFELLWTSHDELNHHYTRYTRRRLSEVVEDAGLRLEFARYFYHWMFPVKLAVRFKEALLGAEPETPSIPRAWLNRLLYGVSRIEQKTLGRLPLPFGTSLLAVAKRSS
jgi:SAM-dependent methyltransferase